MPGAAIASGSVVCDYQSQAGTQSASSQGGLPVSCSLEGGAAQAAVYWSDLDGVVTAYGAAEPGRSFDATAQANLAWENTFVAVGGTGSAYLAMMHGSLSLGANCTTQSSVNQQPSGPLPLLGVFFFPIEFGTPFTVQVVGEARGAHADGGFCSFSVIGPVATDDQFNLVTIEGASLLELPEPRAAPFLVALLTIGFARRRSIRRAPVVSTR